MKYVLVRTFCKSLSRAHLIAAFALLASLIAPLTTNAATITVDTLSDGSVALHCTLHDAITAANSKAIANTCVAGTGTDIIQFSVTGTIALSGPLPNVTDANLTITGPGGGITIDGGGTHQVMIVNSGAVLEIQDLTIANGHTSFGGGAIENAGTLTVTNSTFSGNSASISGGGIVNFLTLTVTNSTFFNNNGGVSGGGIDNESATLAITNSTFSSDSAVDFGGAIENNGGTLGVTNSTFSGNTAIFGGAVGSTGTPVITNCTFSGNSAISGAGIAGNAKLKGTILTASSSGGNCVGTMTDAGYNISSDNSCGFSGTSKSNTDPLLDPAGLANNGGPTETIALLEGSPAIDLIPVLACTDQALIPQPLTTDQRGFTRPDAGDVPPACDVGAYESGFANDLILNTSTVQVVHNSGTNADVLNMALNVTSNEAGCDGGADDLLESGVSVGVYGGTCAAFSTLCSTIGCPLLPFDFNVNPYVEHDIGSFSYGTFFKLNGGGAVSSKIVALATPPGTCGRWSINLQATGLNLSSITSNSVALFLDDSDGDGRCFTVNAQVGNGIVKPHHGVRNVRR